MEPLDGRDPRQVGSFELEGRLGQGGMGRVYLARTTSGERVALKVIHESLSGDPQFRERFNREVAAVGRVHNRRTADLVAADPDGNPPWLAVEFIDGPTLQALVDR